MYAKKRSAAPRSVPRHPAGAKGRKCSARTEPAADATSASSAATAIPTASRLVRADLRTPSRFSAVNSATAATDTGRAGSPGTSASRYAPSPTATVPAAAVLLARNIHPAANPACGWSTR